MTHVDLTEIERFAQKSLDLPAFPINLRQVRETVADLLNEVGRYGFFDEYTDHSFDGAVRDVVGIGCGRSPVT